MSRRPQPNGNRKNAAKCALAFMAVGLGFGPRLPAATYSITEIAPSSIANGASGINNEGEVTGYYTGYGNRAFLYRPNGGLVDLGTLGGLSSWANDINSHTQVVGASAVSGSENEHPFLYTPGSGMVDLGTLGGPSGRAIAINSDGAVVGQAFNALFQQRAFLFTRTDGMVDLGTLGGSGSWAHDINDSGRVVGVSTIAGDVYSHAFLHTPEDGMVDLGTLGGDQSHARGINENGQVVGGADLPSTRGVISHAFLFTPGEGMQDIGTLGGISIAEDINDSGQVVGGSYLAGNVHPPRAFLYTPGRGMVDLNSLLPADSGWRLDYAYDINNAGQIVGQGIYNNRVSAFVMTPVLPMANAGPDQTVEEASLVTLDGSGSRDPESDPLSYRWEQVAGAPTVTLDLSDPVHPAFTAPNVTREGSRLTFQLIVNDGTTDSAPDQVDITIKDVNHAPVADAGPDQTLHEDSPVVLDGSNSYDLDDDDLAYHWVQTVGPSVSLTSSSTARPSFTAPTVGSAGATLTFRLTVDDGNDTGTDSVSVRVDNVNHAPVAKAGEDQTTDEGGGVTLDGTGSTDPDSDPLNYSWTQVSGPAAELSDSASPTPRFTAPTVGAAGADLGFELVVNDGQANSAPDLVTVHILDRNAPPACQFAAASPALLWPPDRALERVVITGLGDPGNNTLALTVTAVTQDEPVAEGGSSPDAVIQGDGVFLRAEREGNGNGRVYAVDFMARDSTGGSCAGTVRICVPRNPQASQCADDGRRYDSLQR